VAHVCTIVPISLTVGANRIIPAVAIPHPLGDPEKTPAEEKKLRKAIVKKALLAMQTPVDEQTVFDE
jgi:glycine reductase